MGYRIDLSLEASKHLSTLDPVIARRIIKKLQWFSKQDDTLRWARHLVDSNIGDIRFRIGEYRAVGILYQSSRTIIIVALGHRREIYR